MVGARLRKEFGYEEVEEGEAQSFVSFILEILVIFCEDQFGNFDIIYISLARDPI